MDEDRTQPLPPPPPPPPQGPPLPPGRPGWDADEPFYRRHGLAFAIASGVLALVLLLGLVGVGTFAVSSVVARAAHSISQDRQAQPGPGNGKGYGNGNGNGKRGLPGDPGQGAGGMKQGSALARGTVESISASSWTIRTANGTTVTVAITPQTVFGAPATGGSASDFRRGDQVIVLGKRSGNTITAARIVNIGALRSPGTPSPTPTP